MKMINRLIDSILKKAQRRFQDARPGSVLILVVALLVLIALAGTAMISTARIDRYASQQNAANTQVDLLLQGMAELAKATLIDDLFGGTAGPQLYRPPYDKPPPTDALTNYSRYEHADSPYVDFFLASRTPIPAASGTGGDWFAVSAPLVTTQTFEDPSTGQLFPFRYLLRPSYKSIAYAGGSKTFPALIPEIANSNPWAGGSGGAAFVGGDADGDGVADSGLWRVPIGELNGVTYYVCMRIIDNGSAINASTALAPWDNSAYPAAGNGDQRLPVNLFTSNVNLHRMLLNGTGPYAAYSRNGQMYKLDEFRSGANGASFDPTSAPPAGPPSPSTPVTEDGTALRGGGNGTDYTWLSYQDQLYHELGRRLDNPGFYAPQQPFRALPITDSATLAYHFILQNGYATTPSTLESMLKPTLLAPTVPYPLSDPDIAAWYNNNFNYGSMANDVFNRRALMVARNPTSNLTMARGDATAAGVPANLTTIDRLAAPYNFYDPFPGKTGVIPRAAVNTAETGELWRAYWDVMMPRDTSLMPVGQIVPAQGGSYQMFRSPRRDPGGTATMGGQLTVLLRSALASVNTVDYRDSDEDVTTRDFQVNLPDGAVTVRVFGAERQPYITEVYVNNENDTPTPPPASPPNAMNPKGYIGIELYNPTSSQITMRGWTFGLVERSAAKYTGGQMTIDGLQPNGPLVTIPDTTIPPNGFIWLDNFPDGGPGAAPTHDAQYRPLGAGTVAGQHQYVPYLNRCLQDPQDQTRGGHELVLMRPIKSYPTGETDLTRFAPLDSFDFRPVEGKTGGISLVAAGSMTFQAWHYARNTIPTQRWQCTYPGRYATAASDPAGSSPMRQEGVVASQTWAPGAPEPWANKTPVTPAADNGANATFACPYAVGVQLANVDTAGPNKLQLPGSGANEPKMRYPFGAFARNGDILQVPFIGSYMFVIPGAPGDNQHPATASTLREINPVTMDLLAADDNDKTDDSYEQVGRFCPLEYINTTMDPTTDKYAWATDLFDHLTVQNPQDDYSPNADPRINPDIQNGASRYGFYSASQYNNLPAPEPVKNSLPAKVNPNIPYEDTYPIDGLININTANWRVLATLPFTQDEPTNEAIAKAIVTYRDGSITGTPAAPKMFATIFDLNRVQAFVTANNTFNPAGLVNLADGDLSPYNDGAGGEDGASPGDFETRFMIFNRISNMITTRSDSYTVYIQVQGWRFPGTNRAELAVQRRLAFIADRSNVTPTNKTITTTIVPND